MEADSLLREVGVSRDVMEKVRKFRQGNRVDEGLKNRMPKPEYIYYGEKVWHQALAALLAGSNLLLTGPKATGKNVLAECLAFVMGRPEWNVSFHVNVDAAYLIGTDTYDGSQVVFRPGPIYACARGGGFGILDEVNMAKNEALAVLHATLDYRRVIDVPGYQKIDVSEATRFIGTMNNGYAGARRVGAAERFSRQGAASGKSPSRFAFDKKRFVFFGCGQSRRQALRGPARIGAECGRCGVYPGVLRAVHLFQGRDENSGK